MDISQFSASALLSPVNHTDSHGVTARFDALINPSSPAASIPMIISIRTDVSERLPGSLPTSCSKIARRVSKSSFLLQTDFHMQRVHQVIYRH